MTVRRPHQSDASFARTHPRTPPPQGETFAPRILEHWLVIFRRFELRGACLSGLRFLSLVKSKNSCPPPITDWPDTRIELNPLVDSPILEHLAGGRRKVPQFIQWPPELSRTAGVNYRRGHRSVPIDRLGKSLIRSVSPLCNSIPTDHPYPPNLLGPDQLLSYFAQFLGLHDEPGFVCRPSLSTTERRSLPVLGSGLHGDILALGRLSRPVRPRVLVDRLRLSIRVDDPVQRQRLFAALDGLPDAKTLPSERLKNRRFRSTVKALDAHVSWRPVGRGGHVSLHLFASACHSGRLQENWAAFLMPFSLTSVEVSQLEIAVDYPMPPSLICPWAPRARREALEVSQSEQLAKGRAPNMVTGGSAKRRNLYDKVEETARRNWDTDHKIESPSHQPKGIFEHLQAVRSDPSIGRHLARVEERRSLQRAGAGRYAAGLLEREHFFDTYGLIDLACAAQYDPLLAYFLIFARYRGHFAAQEFFERDHRPEDRKPAKDCRKERLAPLHKLSSDYIVQPKQAVELHRQEIQDRIMSLIVQVVGPWVPGAY